MSSEPTETKLTLVFVLQIKSRTKSPPSNCSKSVHHNGAKRSKLPKKYSPYLQDGPPFLVASHFWGLGTRERCETPAQSTKILKIFKMAAMAKIYSGNLRQLAVVIIRGHK